MFAVLVAVLAGAFISVLLVVVTLSATRGSQARALSFGDACRGIERCASACCAPLRRLVTSRTWASASRSLPSTPVRSAPSLLSSETDGAQAVPQSKHRRAQAKALRPRQ
ncbi:hypothetical protein [Streptosporangium saharense]|uniref:Uncharacterized protein n=1 Tax=Streptosporangium saharense TaxID=1706840 RepID=A0A7W7QL63_9ACTN|nr:hypothetical protein [Streptosporangium saharense]MBB4915610.1 hypothetical protein [Streptosporangium saharense]